MKNLSPDTAIADLVLERPSRARVFEQLGLDYCCGGKRSLADACRRRGLDADDVLASLDAEAAPASEEPDLRDVPLAEVCDHIVEVHHARLREELPRLSGLLAKVVRAHGAGHPELAVQREVFEGLRSELEEHLEEEENVLFPVCAGLDTAGDPAWPEGLELSAFEDDHAAAGAGLERLSELTGGYALEGALCNTHRATLSGLAELSLDLHRHIHEENNILFPRALAILERSKT
ncbi:MAG TPA: iron-sulfur cluster repair di-iron protein [Gaiellaceae bacterium]|nr:iron-sulfur cluster repair di-iron protein [Gaiellaceae bacterium]